MIRRVTPADAPAIADIYNHYVVNTVVSFETEPVTVEAMRRRIGSLSADYPYFVCEEEGVIAGYCYAHAWKERAAYAHTFETTVYLSPQCRGCGVGRRLMERLIAECRLCGCHALIACITACNTASRAFHERLGFRQVSLFRSVGFKHGSLLDVADYELLLIENEQ